VDPFDEHRVLSDVETSRLEPIVVQTRGITRGRPRERTTLRESEDDLDRVAEERLYPVADPLTAGALFPTHQRQKHLPHMVKLVAGRMPDQSDSNQA
jgi:hypothetical protein